MCRPRRNGLGWLTGFSGSAGMAAVLPETAAIFVDGRYTLQVRSEVPEQHFTPRHLTDEPLSRLAGRAFERRPKASLRSLASYR